MSGNKLIIFYDGCCPLCSLEMDKLKRSDHKNLIQLENLHQNKFTTRFSYIDSNKAMKILHGYYRGRVLLGLDVTYCAWNLVGKGRFVAPLKLPIVREVASYTYLLFAKNRHYIATFLYHYFGVGLKNYDKGVCDEKSNDCNNWRKQ